MTQPYLAAAVQMQSGEDKRANLATAIRLVEEAAAGGAQLVALPELFNCLGDFARVCAEAESVPGPTSDCMANLAARLRITLLAGSIAERAALGPATVIYNTSVLFDPAGGMLARYRKIHRFDVDLPGQVVARESNWFAAGDNISTVATPLGNLGTAICYDLRFSEVFRQMASAGTEVILLPSAFTLHTGRDHWEVLLRARAIENQAYVVAPNQYGPNASQLVSYGHSAIVDPWGRVMATGPESGDAIVAAEIDLEYLSGVRRQLPALLRTGANSASSWAAKNFPQKFFGKNFYSRNSWVRSLSSMRFDRRRHDFRTANNGVEHAWEKLQEGYLCARPRSTIQRNKLLDKFRSLRKMSHQSSVAVSVS